MRQDKRFRSGEAISQQIIADLIGKYFDSVFIMDPHLHRKKSLTQVFKSNPVRLSANPLIVEYIHQRISSPILIGPDEESYKWAKKVGDMLGVESRILRKERFSSYHVEVKLNKKIELKGRNVVIVDDIVSTGHTILETAKIIEKLGAKSIYCICVHGIFVGEA
jgi:ribose-phosphate pyrophosphokinase